MCQEKSLQEQGQTQGHCLGSCCYILGCLTREQVRVFLLKLEWREFANKVDMGERNRVAEMADTMVVELSTQKDS